MNEDVDFSGAWETFWSQFAPGVIIPLFLKIFDWVANAVVALFAV